MTPAPLASTPTSPSSSIARLSAFDGVVGTERVEFVLHLLGLLTLPGCVLGKRGFQVAHPLTGENARLVFGIGTAVRMATIALGFMDCLSCLGKGSVEVLLRRYERQPGIVGRDFVDHVVGEVGYYCAHRCRRPARIALPVFGFRAGPGLVAEDVQGIGMHELRHAGDRRHVGPLADAVVAVATITVFDDGIQVADPVKSNGARAHD